MAESKNHNEFYDMTFSQREGKAPLPDPMRLEHIPKKFRKMVLDAVQIEIVISCCLNEEEIEFLCLSDKLRDANRLHYVDEPFISTVLIYYQSDILDMYLEKIRISPMNDIDLCRKRIKDGEWHEVLTLVEYILRKYHHFHSDRLPKELMNAFDSTPIAYFVENIKGLPTILPRASREAGEATQKAFETLRTAGMDPAISHLRQAAEHVDAGQFADSITDSIHAVESVARTICPGTETLGPALAALKREGLLKHKALKQAFSKLYGYTSDEQGLRHPLLDKDAPDVGLDEAVFMFGACASFAAYLANKHR